MESLATTPATRVRQGTPPPGSLARGPLRLVGGAIAYAWVALNVSILVWLILASLKQGGEVFSEPFALPSSAHWDNYSRAWSTQEFGAALRNTVLVVGGASLVIVALSAPAAYALTRLRARTAGPIVVFLAIGIGIPLQTVIIPLYVLLNDLRLGDSLLGLFVVYVALSLPFTVFLLTGFFRSLPEELEEAAAVDGASSFRTFWQIVVPLARGGLITALILNAIGLWNEVLLALILLNTQDNFTLARALFDFYGTMQYNSDWGGLMAGVCIVVLPMLVLYVWLGRRIVEGLTLGAGK